MPTKRPLSQSFWDELYTDHATPAFIIADPISIPHQYIKKYLNTLDPRDAEFISFLVAMFAYGQRGKIIETMSGVVSYFQDSSQDSPIEKLLTSSDKQLQKAFSGFYYRFNVDADLVFILSALRGVYKKRKSLQALWQKTRKFANYPERIQAFQDSIMHEASVPHPDTYGMQFLLAQPQKGSAAKRLNMFLRWVIRCDAVDLGLWTDSEDLANLRVPLDTHVGRLARQFKLTQRASNNWQTVEEITRYFKSLNADDPVRYDIAMMGLGTAAS